MARKDEKKPEAETTEAKDAAKVETKVDSTEAETQPIPVPAAAAPATDKELPAIEPPAPKGEPWPDATPEPMRPVAPAQAAEPARSRTDTAVMPQVAPVGAPPEMPKTTAPPAPRVTDQVAGGASRATGAVENPTHMPGPRDVPTGNPEDPAPAPGRVPAGDSRSLRRGNDFALVYRQSTFVISRFGAVGTRGQWRVVEYPTSSAASHAYAKECSRFVSEGFSDYRE
ncbi:MAG TPA: hypothetical protein VMJ10_01640 [Kofleriaceae bacterium]|nr:hypothetical protein [Kofleriaceae bacterium]